MFQPGDRVRWTTSDAGLPICHYGFVRAVSPTGFAAVLFDDELSGSRHVPVCELEAVSVTAIELRLSGTDLLDDPDLRQGLVALWSAEADDAGLEVENVAPQSSGADDTGEYTLASLVSGGMTYLLNAGAVDPTGEVWVRAQPGLSHPGLA